MTNKLNKKFAEIVLERFNNSKHKEEDVNPAEELLDFLVQTELITPRMVKNVVVLDQFPKIKRELLVRTTEAIRIVSVEYDVPMRSVSNIIKSQYQLVK